jgi:autotransporter-associated beta strand protein
LELSFSADGNFKGKVTGGGGLIKSGAGKTTLTAENDYAGKTTIKGGVLSLPNANASKSTSSYETAANSALEIAYGGEFGGKVTGPGGLIANPGASNTLTLKTKLEYSGLTTVQSGVLKLDNDLTSKELTLYGGATFDKNGKAHTLEKGVLNVVVLGNDSAVYKGDLTASEANITFITDDTPLTSKPLLSVEGNLDFKNAFYTVGSSGKSTLKDGTKLTLFKASGTANTTGLKAGTKIGVASVGSTVVSDITASISVTPGKDGSLGASYSKPAAPIPPVTPKPEKPQTPAKPAAPETPATEKPDEGNNKGKGDETIKGEVGPAKVKDEAKAISEGHLGSVAISGLGSDLIASKGTDAAVSSVTAAGSYSPSGFGAISGGTVRHNTGSYAETTGVSLMAGLAKGIDTGSGRLVLGGFAEFGNGSYDTYNSFAGGVVKGDGDSSYIGGGILFRMDFNNNAQGNLYLEGSGRIGNVKNEYKSRDLKDAQGNGSAYKTSSAYYGFHLGAGYVFQIKDAYSLDLYGKYFFTRQEGDEARLSTGEILRFEDTDSSRIRAGLRFSYLANKIVTPYFGVAYERELKGKAKVSTNGLPIQVPSLSGTTGVGELGLLFTPSETLPISFDLGVQGYTGKKEGVTGSLMVKLVF